MVLIFNAVYLRTLGQFTAPDPWNANRVTQFAIDEYVMMPSGATTATDSTQLMHRVGLRSNVDNSQHMIPESLFELWKRGQIPAERLPVLAQAIASRLLKEDFNLILHQSITKTILLPLLAVFVVVVLVGLYAPMSSGNFSLLVALAVGAGFTVLVGLILWMVRQSGRSRRVEQMKWLLAANSGAAVAPLEGRARTQLKRFGLIYAMLLVAMLLAFGGAAVWYQFGRAAPSDPAYNNKTGDIEMPVEMMNSQVPTGATMLVIVPQTAEQVTVKIPPNTSDGTRLRLAGKGFKTAAGKQGDLILKVRVHF